ncbi:MAG TPA: YicC family protein [Phycisphaerales bacterium]|nr:MAG: YicC family protein [Planctomycetes bacterium GWC2_45_44]HBG78103.1 YicC family protein [Phycisphaerales bacterium]HBR20915.1 YicC family protein [Phycisphaerales bacterium]
MLNSMTGFARVCREVNGISYAVEIRSVNNRYFKPNIKLPEPAGFLEQEIERLLRDNIYRGSVNYFLRYKNVSGEPMYEIDSAALKSYVEKLNGISRPQSGIDCTINLADLLLLPGVVRPQEPENEKADNLKKAVFEVTALALEQMKKMREQEGLALADDIFQQCSQIGGLLENIKIRKLVVVQEYRDRLSARVKDLLQSARLELDSDTLAREVALFADRSDISEEIIRLGSHIEQFVASCKQGEHAGRKLDFIAQEMLREANTIASKASDAKICFDVVQIKSCIERIKEQVQNIE